MCDEITVHVTLFGLGDRRYLDVHGEVLSAPSNCKSCYLVGQWWMTTPMHSLFRVSEGEHGLEVRYLEDEALYAAMRVGRIKVEHVADTMDYGLGSEPMGVRLLAAPSKKLRKVLRKIADQEDLFPTDPVYCWMGPLREEAAATGDARQGGPR